MSERENRRIQRGLDREEAASWREVFFARWRTNSSRSEVTGDKHGPRSPAGWRASPLGITLTHTHAPIHMPSPTHAHTHTYMPSHTHAYTETKIPPTDTHAYTHTHKCIAHTPTCMYTHPCPYTKAYAYTHTHPHAFSQRHIHGPSHTQTHTRVSFPLGTGPLKSAFTKYVIAQPSYLRSCTLYLSLSHSLALSYNVSSIRHFLGFKQGFLHELQSRCKMTITSLPSLGFHVAELKFIQGCAVALRRDLYKEADLDRMLRRTFIL